MMCTLAIFLNLIISEYTSHVEDLAKEAKFLTVVEAIYATGSPLSLGFCLHMFLHLFIFYIEIRKCKHIPEAIREGELFQIENETRDDELIVN